MAAKKKNTAKTPGKQNPTSKKVRRGRGKGGTNKSEFIRSQPADMPAKDVVEKGKAAGLGFSEGLVYNVRAAAKKKAGRSSSGRRGPGRPKASASSTSTEGQFRRLVVDLGVARARALLDEVETGMRRLIEGR